MVPYRQGRTAAEDAFKLSSNENPYEPLPAVLQAIAESAINRYPEGSAARLRDLLGERYGVSPERLQVGAGSVSVLAQLITAAAASGDEVVFSWRSFEAYPLLVGTAGATPVMIPNTADHRHDLPAIVAAITERTRLVIVCSPNNPTSTVGGTCAMNATNSSFVTVVLVGLFGLHTITRRVRSVIAASMAGRSCRWSAVFGTITGVAPAVPTSSG